MANLKISQAAVVAAVLDAHEFPLNVGGGVSGKATGALLRQFIGDQNRFRLAANGAALGPTIADYFGANSSLPTVLNGIYELTFWLYYLKTTAGTVTYTITNTQTYTNLVASYLQTAVAGVTPNAAMTAGGLVTNTAAAAALPATAALSAGNHFALITAHVECAAAGNIRLRVTQSAGTITPLRGSFYTARLLTAANVGSFVA